MRLIALSATVSNAEEFGDWLSQVRGGTTVIVDEHRPVPLWQHMLAGHQLYDLFTGHRPPAGRQPRPAPAGPARDCSRSARPAAAATGAGRRAGGRGRPGSGRRAGPRPSRRLDTAGLLPAITFIFSRAGCDAAVAAVPATPACG